MRNRIKNSLKARRFAKNMKRTVFEDYDLFNPKQNKYWSCPVCLEDFKETTAISAIRTCGHYFHGECIEDWLETDGRCPVCRINWTYVGINII